MLCNAQHFKTEHIEEMSVSLNTEVEVGAVIEETIQESV